MFYLFSPFCVRRTLVRLNKHTTIEQTITRSTKLIVMYYYQAIVNPFMYQVQVFTMLNSQFGCQHIDKNTES
ncbi:hypothetical protein L1987_26343 [Smallanthus sonchifolius]|uniref:Uncharacterized protein n=1 Tax=Smallanthus sonchifolius TaxID=185202 RepID=A0ACB9IC50_9ASTR|nr:hypothetical protein L1987_26343 [Smallanthus sonchifolius]